MSVRACGVIAVLLLIVPGASAQDVTEPALKAVFIYNFALFTDWPADAIPPAAPLAICVLGDDAVQGALEREVKGRRVGGRAIAVTPMTNGSQPRACHVIYVSRVSPAEASRIVAGVRDLPVLTISDLESFTGLGGIAQLYFDNGRLRFIVGRDAAQRARLRISSRLLGLANEP